MKDPVDLAQLRLEPIGRHGAIASCGVTPPPLTDVCSHTTQLYEREGFVPPWVGYVAMIDGVCVGTCAFKSAPRKGRVEIAYFTFPEFEGRHIATTMAKKLIDIATSAAPCPEVTAQTLPAENPSTTVLRKLGFERTGAVEHPEDGIVWEWRWRFLTPSSASRS